MTPTSLNHDLTRRDRTAHRDEERAELAAKLVTLALTKAFAKTKVKVNGECEVAEINDRGQCVLSLPAISIVADVSHPQLTAEWALQDFEVEITGAYHNVEAALRVLKS